MTDKTGTYQLFGDEDSDTLVSEVPITEQVVNGNFENFGLTTSGGGMGPGFSYGTVTQGSYSA